MKSDSQMDTILSERMVFISDVHLAECDSQRQQYLVEFLQRVSPLRRLYILGDLFDFWFGYKTVVFRFFFPLLCQLNQMVKSGTELVYVLGNHDFNLGPLFEETIPMRIISHSSIETIGLKNAYLIHGDGIDRSDRGYRVLRIIVRSKVVQWLFRWIHPDIGWKMARLLAHSSRSYTNWKDMDKVRAYRHFGHQILRSQADVCIMGHTHFPLFEEVTENGNRKLLVNLGDWIEHFTFLEFSPQRGFELKQYDPLNQSIARFNPEQSG